MCVCVCVLTLCVAAGLVPCHLPWLGAGCGGHLVSERGEDVVLPQAPGAAGTPTSLLRLHADDL